MMTIQYLEKEIEYFEKKKQIFTENSEEYKACVLGIEHANNEIIRIQSAIKKAGDEFIEAADKTRAEQKVLKAQIESIFTTVSISAEALGDILDEAKTRYWKYEEAYDLLKIAAERLSRK
jgi:hypothetical protein